MEAFIISAVRTPVGIGKTTGSLAGSTPLDISVKVIQEVIKRANVDPSRIEDVIWGCVTQVGDQGANLARLAVLKSGLPVQVPAVTLDRMCGSSQQAIHFAAQAILSGDMDIVLAGGTEMMSHHPIGSDWPDQWGDDFPYDLVHQGISAERIAEKWNLTRTELDDYAYSSHIKAMHAIQKGYFTNQITPVEIPGNQVFGIDEGVRIPPDREKMTALKPAFLPDGKITAGNASQVSDGSAALLLASPKAVGRSNLVPLARIVARDVIGSDPVLMLDGPIPATQRVLKKAGLTLEDMDVIEINEAFASVVLAWSKDLRPNMKKVNPNGGAIALGHPLGATGAILMTKLVYELIRTGGQYGLQTMCIGHGMATATVIERL